MQRWAIPVENEPVILLTELNVPAAIPLIRLDVPSTNPRPASIGPWTIPSFGLLMNS